MLSVKAGPDRGRSGSCLVRKDNAYPTLFPRVLASLSAAERACINGFAASFQKPDAMDCHITKYQGKPMEALTPLFMTMMSGIRRLEEQEEQEDAEAEAARQAGQS